MNLRITDEMDDVKVNALCVRTVDYNDNDRLITLCTAEKGKILVKARGCKTPKAKLKYASSPLCFGEYLLIQSNKGRYILKGCDCIDNFSDIVKDLERYYAGFAVLECIDKLSKEGETDTCRALLFLGVNALKELAYDDTEPYITLIKFFKTLLEIVGYKLNFDTCAVSGKPISGKRVCFDFTYSGLVLYENRSMYYIEFTPEIIRVLKDNEIPTKDIAIKIIKILDKILRETAYIKNLYSLQEFLNLYTKN